METYKFDYRKGRNRTIAVSAETDDIAKAAGELLLKAVTRKRHDRELVKALTDAAVRWRRQADAINRPSDDLKRYYIEKSRRAIDEAARVIAEGEK